jgi:DMSO reductase anchor subunit
MNPAWSVILLTTLIGAGQGLFLALFTVESYAAFALLPPQGGGFFALGGAVALALLAAGLVASFFHLGRPARAWRAAAQWRSSWLAREVIVLPAFIAAVVLYGGAHLFGVNPRLGMLPSGVPLHFTVIVGAAASVLAFLLFVCTAMIYACLRFLREWHTPLTVVNYILLGGASGFVLATALAARVAPDVLAFLAGWAMVLTALAFVARVATLARNRRLAAATPRHNPIGIRHTHIAQRAQGAMGGSFNTREFFHGRSDATVRAVQRTFLALCFPVPLVLLALGWGTQSAAVLAAAFAAQYAGLLAERWSFFAQANHPQNLYYRSTG